MTAPGSLDAADLARRATTLQLDEASFDSVPLVRPPRRRHPGVAPAGRGAGRQRHPRLLRQRPDALGRPPDRELRGAHRRGARRQLAPTFLWTSRQGPLHSRAAHEEERRRWRGKLQTELRAWTVKDSVELYNVNGWGRDFFSINEAGNVEVTPAGPGSLRIDLKELVDDLRSRGLNLPILIRFSDILRTRVEQLFGAFQQAIAENDYKGAYRGRLPDQGQPAAPRGRGADGVRPALQPGDRGGLQAGAARRPRPPGEPRGPHPLQRLQGPGLHRDGAPRPEARPAGRHHHGPRGRAGHHPRRRRRAGPAAGDRGAGAAHHQGRGQVGGVDRRPLQVRPHHRRDRGRGGEAARGGDARLPAAAPLPHRLADHEHPGGEGRAARGEPDLRGAARPRRQHALPRLRGRARRRLRRQPDELPLLGELHPRRVRGRHREPGGRGLQRAGRAPSRPRHRVGAGPRRAPLRARLQRPRHERDPRRTQPASRRPRASTR